MTTTALRSEQVISDDDKHTALIWFAEQAIIRWTELDPVLPEVVGALAHPTHVDSGTHMALFELLVEAVRELQSFDRDDRAWLQRNDEPIDDRSYDRVDEALHRNIDLSAYDLVHPGPSCVTCRRTRPRQAWRAAQWPSSLWCEEHRAVRGVVA